ncbi:hypothetical protein KA531_03495 [Candidatus Saccharibacteria bacterium]|nr:hypothetical protein [Candidatus Saccharibacteria bacterium]
MTNDDTDLANIFQPDLTPQQMLELGIFGGAYFPTIPSDLPPGWFVHAKISPAGKPIPSLNYYGVIASQSRAIWEQKGWINPIDPLGWFQWYCRYYLGRRLEIEDTRQIKRWLAIKRHKSQIISNCIPEDQACRPKQRQALLQWAYDPRRF